MREYQKAARDGGAAFEAYMEKYIFSCADFDEYLEKAGGLRKYNRLRQEMVEMV
jgi:hypothetical protein